MLMSVVLITMLCVAAYALAVYALPFMLGLTAAQFAYQTGSGLIGAGLGASVLPEHAIGNEAADKKVRLMRVEGRRLHRQLSLITLKSSYHPNAVEELGKLILAELGTKRH